MKEKTHDRRLGRLEGSYSDVDGESKHLRYAVFITNATKFAVLGLLHDNLKVCTSHVYASLRLLGRDMITALQRPYSVHGKMAKM